MVFRGCVQPAQNRPETDEQIDVAATSGDCAQVVEQDDEGSDDEQGEHQNRHPCRTLLDVFGNGGRVAARGRNSMLVMIPLAFTGGLRASALRGRSSARSSFRRCHDQQV